MRKVLSIIAIMSMLLSLTVFSYADESANENVAMVTVRNTLSGEVTTYEAMPVNACAMASENEMISMAYEVFIPIPTSDVMPADSESGSKTSHGVTATVGVDYIESSDQEQYKATRFYGSWQPNDSLYYLTYREAGISSGGISSTVIRENPSTNSYSYATGWGYRTKVPNSEFQQKVFSIAEVCVSGMEHMGTYEISLYCPFASY